MEPKPLLPVAQRLWDNSRATNIVAPGTTEILPAPGPNKQLVIVETELTVSPSTDDSAVQLTDGTTILKRYALSPSGPIVSEPQYAVGENLPFSITSSGPADVTYNFEYWIRDIPQNLPVPNDAALLASIPTPVF